MKKPKRLALLSSLLILAIAVAIGAAATTSSPRTASAQAHPSLAIENVRAEGKANEIKITWEPPRVAKDFAYGGRSLKVRSSVREQSAKGCNPINPGRGSINHRCRTGARTAIPLQHPDVFRRKWNQPGFRVLPSGTSGGVHRAQGAGLSQRR